MIAWAAVQAFLVLWKSRAIAWVKTWHWWVWSHLGVLVVSVLLGMHLARPKPVARETPAPEIRQIDSSLVLRRDPDADRTPTTVSPKGTVLERKVQVVVRPKPAFIDSGAVKETGGLFQSPDVHVGIEIVRLPDLTRRAIASSSDGTIIGGVDIPVDPLITAAPVHHWAAGPLVVADSSGHGFGAFITRDVGRLRALGFAHTMHGGQVGAGLGTTF